jgi:hypothetical protein
VFSLKGVQRPIIAARVGVATTTTRTSVKVIGSNGQISLGKEFAGRQVLVEEQEPGVWLVRTARVVPENELWLHQPKAREDLRRALDWTQRHSPRESNPDAVLKGLEHGRRSKRKKGSARSEQ